MSQPVPKASSPRQGFFFSVLKQSQDLVSYREQTPSVALPGGLVLVMWGAVVGMA